jgi:hypothetical protein
MLALCSLPVTGLFVASAAAPTPSKVSKVFVAQPKVPRARHKSGRDLDPKLAGVVVSAMRRYVDDAKDPTDIDLTMKKRLAKVPRAKKSVARMLAKIDALPAKTRAITFVSDEATHARVSTSDVIAMKPSRMQAPFQFKITTVALPAEGIDIPTSVKLVLAGVTSTKARDADGSDELVVVVDRFVTDAVAETVMMPASGTVKLAENATRASGKQIYEGVDESAMLISAVFEDDDGSTSTARDDYRAMIELARGLADSVAGATPTERFEVALDTCIGLLEISAPQVFADGAITWSSIGYGGTSLHDAYAIPASDTGGVAWKLRHDHSFGGGTYELLFNVPSPPPPELKTIKVRVLSVKSLTDKEREPEREYSGSNDTEGTLLPKTEYDLSLDVGIRGEWGSWDFADNDTTPIANFEFTRVVLPGKVKIEVQLTDRGTDADGCGYGWGTGNCDCCEELDLRPGSGTMAKLTYDPKTGSITGDATGKAGDLLTLKGDATKKTLGEVVVEITQE